MTDISLVHVIEGTSGGEWTVFFSLLALLLGTTVWLIVNGRGRYLDYKKSENSSWRRAGFLSRLTLPVILILLVLATFCVDVLVASSYSVPGRMGEKIVMALGFLLVGISLTGMFGSKWYIKPLMALTAIIGLIIAVYALISASIRFI